LDEFRSFEEVPGLTLTGTYAMGAIRSRYAIELRNWKAASELAPLATGVPWARALVWEAIGEGSARSGKLERAIEAEETLAELRDEAEKKSTYWSKQIEVQRREVNALIAEQRGRKEEALAMMRSAVELEESMDKDAVTPGPVTPAREMLAGMLMAQRRDTEALSEYEAVLKVAPRRFNALYDAAVAANRSGKDIVAMEYFRALMGVATSPEREEVFVARKKFAELKKSTGMSKFNADIF